MATSPELTGGAGFTYEAGVAATYLSSLLLEGDARGLRSSTITRVELQRADLGEPLDDIIVHGMQRGGLPAKLGLQVKANITISINDSVFKEIIGQCWATIENKSFRKGFDRVGLATGQIAAKPYRDVRTLTEWARASADAEDFLERVQTIGSSSKQVIVEAFRTHSSAVLKREAVDDDVWLIFKHFVLLRFEVLGEGASDSHNCTALLRAALLEVDSARSVELWNSLTNIADNAAGTAGSFDRIALREALSAEFSFCSATSTKGDLERLAVETDLASDEIKKSIGGCHIERVGIIEQCEEALDNSRLVQITGRPGSGKSVLLRRLIERQRNENPVLLLKSNRLMSGGWAGFSERHQLSSTSPDTVLLELGATHQPILFIDGLDRVQIEHQPAVRDIIATILNKEIFKNWRIVATVRDGLSEHLDTWLPAALQNEKLKTVIVGPLDDIEAGYLAKSLPALNALLFADDQIQEISRRPFFLEVLSRLLSEADQQLQTEVDLAELWWRESGYPGTEPMRRKRQQVLLKLAEEGAQKLGRDIPIKELDADAIAGLIADQVILPKIEGHTVDFVHDIFFEWSFFQSLIAEFVTENDWKKVLASTGQPPALERCVTLMSQYAFEREKGWEKLFDDLAESHLRKGWLRAWLLAPVISPLFTITNNDFTDWIFADSVERLKNLLNWSQATRTQVNRRILENPELLEMRDELAYIYSWPADFLNWKKMCAWLVRNREKIPRHLRPDVLTVFQIWQNATSQIKNPVSKAIVETAMEWLLDFEDYETEWRNNRYKEGHFSELSHQSEQYLANNLRSIVFTASLINTDITEAYLDRLLADGNARSEAMETILTYSPVLSQSVPEKLSNVFLKDMLRELPKAHQERMLRQDEEHREYVNNLPEGSREREMALPILGSDGINSFDWDALSIDRGHQNFYPASPAQQPFQAMFEHSPEHAIIMVRTMANHAIQAWRELHEIDWERGRKPIPEVIKFSWGQETYWGSYREYGAYRGVLAPDALSSGLMALELWAHDQLAAGRSVDELIKKILPNQQHIAVLGLAAALIIGTQTVTAVTLPIIACQRLWHWEILRTLDLDRPKMYANLFGVTNQRHAEELRRLNAFGRRSDELRQVAMTIILGKDTDLKSRFRELLSAFPKNLPLEFEDERNNKETLAELAQRAKRFSQLAEAENYSVAPLADGQVQISVKVAEEDQAQLAEISEQQNRMNMSLTVFRWAEAKFKNETETVTLNFADALGAAKQFTSEINAGGIDPQDIIEFRPIAVAAVASLILYGNEKVTKVDLDWAFGRLTESIQLPPIGVGQLPSGQIYSSDPMNVIPYGLVGCLKHSIDEMNAIEMLFRFLTHESEDIRDATLKAISGLKAEFPDFFWNIFALRLDLAIRNDPVDFHSARTENSHALKQLRIKEAITDAIERHTTRRILFPEIPTAWQFAPLPRTGDPRLDEHRSKSSVWRNPDVWLDVDNLEKLFKELPLPGFLEDNRFRESVLDLCERLLDWTIDRYSSQEEGHEPDRLSRDHWDWKWHFPGWLGELSSFLPAEETERRFLNRILSAPDTPGQELLQHFVSDYTCLSVLDADQLDLDIIPLLVRCAAKLEPKRWDKRNNRISNDLSLMLSSLTFTRVEFAGDAKRFANNDYDEVETVIPVIDAVLDACGMVTPTVSQWLTLLERAKEAYPTDTFLRQVNSLLLAKSAVSWQGTRIPSRLSAMIRLHAEKAPLTKTRQLKMLDVLDNLIDEGDRRSASLQRSELFRSTLLEH